MKYFIITGTSRGLGEAIAKELIAPNHHVIGISRNENDDLMEIARLKNGHITFYNYDLNEVNQLNQIMKQLISEVNLEDLQSIYLINNAGIVAPIKPIDKADDQSIIQNIHVNLLAPMLLVSSFISNTEELNVEKKVINISSGAGKKPYYGWASYSSSKAGIDIFTQSVALEQNERKNPVRLLSIAPGVIDTNMQNEIRTTTKKDFIQLDRFIRLKEEGNLQSPEEAAKKLLVAFFDDHLENGAVIDIRDYYKG